MQWCTASFITAVDVGPGFQQNCNDHRRLAVSGCQMQCCTADIIMTVDSSTRLQQRTNYN